MLGGKTAGKHSGKPARQLLFSEALLHSRPSSSTTGSHLTAQPYTMTDTAQEATMEHILQEITAVGPRLEGMDSAITSLTEETKSMRLDIAGFQSRVTRLEQRVSTMEDHINTAQDRDQELLYLLSKLVDLEDRSCWDNVRFFVFLEHIKGSDIQSFLKDALPKLMDLAFNPPLEFQREHRLGLKRRYEALRPRPIIACLLLHGQVHHLLLVARPHGPFQAEEYKIRITADF
ncbi:hypothetical protein NDU88_010110 [Pleurodeles waltl]|uniref:Uncharacterized protein n=1 Tax=Pleurodeles waltl TaxID=8319 RepID=A0AAV7S070_PLEWA|nr:hypothetical protein NDU88_010110 [Pleurodeles waltl]